MNQKRLSEMRVSIEMLLFVIGLFAGVLLIYGLFVDLPEFKFSLEKTKEVISSIPNFNLESIVIIVLAAIFLIFTIRFLFVLKKVKKRGKTSKQ